MIQNFLCLLFFFSLLSCSQERRNLSMVRKENPSSFKEILDRDGQILHETRTNFKVHRRAWIKLEELPEGFIQELLSFEDQRFYSHPGVDFLALAHSFTEYPRRGASTMTMQLAGLLKHQRGRRSWKEKITQMAEAFNLDASWEKKAILEAYINLLSFKGELQGLRAASFGLFGKEPLGLNHSERLLLLGMIPSPNQSKEKLLRRSCHYLHRKTPKASCDDLAEALANSFYDHPRTELTRTDAPHLAQRLKKEPLERIKTTLDGNLQREALSILRSHLKNLEHQNVTDGAILIVDRKSGKVLTYVGSSGDLSTSSLVDHIQSLRQAGSTLKPFLFGSAIAKRLITMTTPLKDEPFTITREGLTYQPENYQKGFTYKNVPAKVALGSSLNIPAVRVMDYLSPERFYDLLGELEFRKLQDVDFYGHSMALGAVDVTLWDLVRGYRALAEDGSLQELSFLPQEVNPKKTISDFSPQVSFIMKHILSEKDNRFMTFGIQSTLSTESWSAVKTGTSKDMRDNWCVGFTDTYVIGVWVGNSSGDSMWNVTGISGAAPIFSQLVTYLHRQNPSLAPTPPSGLVAREEDYYLPGTEPRGMDLEVKDRSVMKILFPQQGAQFAYDPEIPRKNQRILFQGNGTKGVWKLNGESLSRRKLNEGFVPERKGKYRLELWDDQKKKDEVSFYVKTESAKKK
jgi:penicillin-binding protein 1C